jgi:hypothetical protein
MMAYVEICIGNERLSLREERRLKVFENMVLRRVFGSKRDEVTGEWRKLHNEELNNLYSLSNIVRVVKSRRMGCGVILRWVFRKWEGVVGTGWSGLRIGTGGGHL